MTDETFTLPAHEPGPYLYRSRFTGRSPDPSRCCANVGHYGRDEQCSKPAKYRETYKGEERGFCGIHRPSAYAKREAERTARWDAERKRSNERWAREDRLREARKAARNFVAQLANENVGQPKGVIKTAKAVLALYPEGSDG